MLSSHTIELLRVFYEERVILDPLIDSLIEDGSPMMAEHAKEIRDGRSPTCSFNTGYCLLHCAYLEPEKAYWCEMIQESLSKGW